jgi:TRAP-type uncharacterized transport system substrate-binding protein
MRVNGRKFIVSVRANLAKVAWKWVAPLAALAALAFACFFYFHSPGHSHYRLSFAAGNVLGTRHKLAQRLQKEVAQRGMALTLEPSKGSEQALDWVNDGKLNLALVQGGLTMTGRPNVRQVAALHMEPMHLAVKKELATNASSSLLALRGKTVDLEEVGSGTHSLAVAILEFVGLKPRDRDPVHGYIPLALDRRQLFAQQDSSRLPDAIFLVSSLPSSTVRYLVTRHGYRLVPLPFAEALALEALEKSAEDAQQALGEGQVVLGRIQATSISAYTYGIEPPVPDKPLPTIGTRLLLVAHKDVPARAVFQLVEGTYTSEFGQLVHPPLDAKLMDLPPEFPWHAGALLYQQRNAPLLSGAVMDSAHKAFAIFAAAASGLFVLWQWTKLYGNAARNRSFKDYITQITRIEERALADERSATLVLSELFALRDRLHRLKTEAFYALTHEDLAGKDLLFGFLLQANDVRNYLTGLILQEEERENKAPLSTSSGG